MTRVAAVQLAPVVGDLSGNLDRAVAAIEEAVAEGAELVVLPELATSGYVFASVDETRSLALSPADPAFDRVAAAGAGAVVVLGFAEADDAGRLFNSAALVDASGVRAVYRKVHLWDQEKRFFTPGDARPPVVETAVGRVGVMICFDLEFPEWTRIAALSGADLLAVPTNWPLVPVPAGERAPEVQIAIATARMNKMAIVCADRTGRERGVDWTGGTSIVDAEGALRSAVGDGTGTAWAELDLLLSRDKRQAELVDLLGDRRPDLYGPLLEPPQAERRG
ncbi:nitrilase-related carbon-nitrogen hydrolase [Amnibacterium sp.]|uniref:nitrilase-related carbon-nitrogen hydrolase n=1 Tax=Amnibacterium sp. TaxID=1872496 RepID=UPI003F7C8D01